ncbi:hypothetical protein TSUD_272780 [Trifolium subterraneum]|uniref:Reverse transcriptase zinc-binding domain-containing protein n=1 Tax=Trifolium subterraneum TaxID=3900 RepID=A0A2Z6NZW6_TRISU|nr:hypothetical protein TSUD_272780 [Trifolium subterraneum]
MEGLKHASIWWRDIWCLGGEGYGNWFGSNISSVLGDGKDFGFWKEKWLGRKTEEEEAAVGDLKLLLEQVQPCRDNKDRRRWIPNTIGLFSVKSAYAAMQDRSTLPELESNTLWALKRLWRNNVRSKVIIFGWRMLLHKLPTKEDLFHKGIIINNLERKCILCNRENEDLEHVFFHCHVAK